MPRLRLPLQVVETVNASHTDRGTLSFDRDPDDGWRNKLIWGDNLHVLASLTDELAGQVDLIYIDPPFDSRQDYKVRIAVGDGDDAADQDLAKLSSVLEEKAYRDTWGKGVESYLQMLYERLVLLRELLSDRGSLFLHLAPNVSHLTRVLLDEIFGGDNFRAEIIWQRTVAHPDTRDFGAIHGSILSFSKSPSHIATVLGVSQEAERSAGRGSRHRRRRRGHQAVDAITALSSPRPTTGYAPWTPCCDPAHQPRRRRP